MATIWYKVKYKKRIYQWMIIWGLCCHKQVSQAGISNYIPQKTVGCNYLFLPEMGMINPCQLLHQIVLFYLQLIWLPCCKTYPSFIYLQIVLGTEVSHESHIRLTYFRTKVIGLNWSTTRIVSYDLCNCPNFEKEAHFCTPSFYGWYVL